MLQSQCEATSFKCKVAERCTLYGRNELQIKAQFHFRQHAQLKGQMHVCVFVCKIGFAYSISFNLAY